MSRKSNPVVTETANENIVLDKLSVGNVLYHTGKGSVRVVRGIVVGTPRGFGRKTAKVASVTGDIAVDTGKEIGVMSKEFGLAVGRTAKLVTSKGRKTRSAKKLERMAAELTELGYDIKRPGLEVVVDDTSAATS